MIHELKIQKQWADAKLAGEKPFEIRINDRGFQKGDIVRYKVIDPKTGEPWRKDDSGALASVHPLELCDFVITYVMQGFAGVESGFCVFADQPVPRSGGRPKTDPVDRELSELSERVRHLEEALTVAKPASSQPAGTCSCYKPDETYLVVGEKPCEHYDPKVGAGVCRCPGCVHCGGVCPTGGSRTGEPLPPVTTLADISDYEVRK